MEQSELRRIIRIPGIGGGYIKEAFMKHRTVEQLRAVAAIRSEAIPQMSRHDRLQRWARLLELEPERRLNTLGGTEFYSPLRRGIMRADGSPISIALADPALRAEGLRDDTYGEAKRFFDLSDRQMHEILCYCRFGATTSGRAAALAIHRMAVDESRPGWFTKLRQWLSGQGV
jgi:hypothetical protein